MHWPLLRVTVAERSMLPALRPGDWLLVRRTRRIREGQIVIARHPGQPDLLLVKRAARRVEGDGEVGGGWWLASDNPGAGAVDSRRFGPVPAALIEGRVLVRYWRSRSLFMWPNGPWCSHPARENPRPSAARAGRGRRLGVRFVFAPPAGPERRHVRPVYAPIGAVSPGVVAADVDEHPLAARRLADAEPVNAQVGEPHGQAHDRPGRVSVGHRAALGVVHVPGLAVVPG